MSVQVETGMTVDAYLDWAEGRSGRYDLLDGKVWARPQQRARHVLTKFAIQVALKHAIAAASFPCEMLPGGVPVRINEHTAFEVDALVYGGEHLPGDARLVERPVILVDVIATDSVPVDSTVKLVRYFGLPSVAHYLLFDPKPRTVIHHRRGEGDLIETRIASSGELHLDPPGLTLPVSALFDA